MSLLYQILMIGIGLFVLLLLIILNRWRKYPEKSLYYNVLSVLLNPLRVFKLSKYKQGNLTIDSSFKYAMKKTGLDDFGKESTTFTSYSAVMNQGSQKSLIFSNLGYLSAQIELNMTFVRKLKTVEWLKLFPQVLNVPVKSPTFVMGLPRTGTTFIHRLLSLDPSVRSPYLWELLAPTPIIKEERNPLNDKSIQAHEADRDKRAKYVKKLFQFRKTLGDSALQHIHEVDWNLHEECLFALSDELPVASCLLYSCYLTWENMIKIDGNSAYKWYKKQLQLLSYQIGEINNNNTRRWVLKCPAHLLYIKSIAKIFPDAKIIWTHRHPINAIPSMCSLVKSLHQCYYENETRDDAALGRAVTDMHAKVLSTASNDIIQSKLDHSHVIYDELIIDPKKVIQNI